VLAKIFGITEGITDLGTQATKIMTKPMELLILAS
tara:strand:- start:251 stop:355 length:105 start_codon:yes stop_codon:yes gene_type:complete